ncbi:MAG: hypothetical protein NTX44_10365 [Ignavibacteriales bacterium]|nr:hypothetical protein [Ignavibacteriales bacterium]
MGRRVAYIVVIFLLVMGCRKEVQKISSESVERIFTGSYSVIEYYEVADGPHAGFKGSSSYTIQVQGDSRRHILLFENIAHTYTIVGSQKGDSIFLDTQKFPYHNEYVSISGYGKYSGDSLFLELFSGGPAGQINYHCRAKKLYLK